MTFDDLEDILNIEKLSFPSPWTRSQFEQEIKNPLSNKFTAKLIHDETAITAAYIIFWAVANEAHILNIAVHPEFQRRGIAKMFINFAIGRMKKQQVREVFLEVRRSNIPAQKLYEGFGFQKIGIRKGYYENNREDAIVMALSIKNVLK